MHSWIPIITAVSKISVGDDPACHTWRCCQENGEKVVINIGEKEDDPVFFISDLLVHLAAEQLEKKASKVIEEKRWISSSETVRCRM